MLRKRPKTSRSNKISNILNTNTKKVLDDATKQSLKDMFEHEDYVKKNGSATSFYKVSDEEMWSWKGQIDATYKEIKNKKAIGFYGKDNGKFNIALLKMVENDWKKEMKKRGLLK